MKKELVILFLLISNLAFSQKLLVNREVINWMLEVDSTNQVNKGIIKQQSMLIDSLIKDEFDLKMIIHNQKTIIKNDSLVSGNQKKENQFVKDELTDTKKALKGENKENLILKILVVLLAITAIAK